MKSELDKTPYYKKRLEEGKWFQDFVQEQLYKHGLSIVSYSSKEYQHKYGENRAGIEMKYDQKYKEKHNLFIEIAEKSHPENPNFIPSGIYADNNTWLYLIGDEDEFFIFAKNFLIQWHKEDKFRTVFGYPAGDYLKIKPTSKGYLIPVNQARKKYAILTIKLNNPQGGLFKEF